MATKIRLRRMGARNNPFYRLVVADSRFATTGRYLEVLGWYDPKKAEKNFSVKTDRVDYWLGVGAQMSATAKSLIKKARAGEGVPPGAAPETKKVDTQALMDAVPEQVEEPVVEEVVAAEEAPVEEAAAEKAPAAEEVPAEDAPEAATDVSAEADEAKAEEVAEEEAPEKQES
ncbi:MAG: 30S ribosomal protein S16 [Kiritimatiellales bacterium]|nr:30S ribosomal protein S16 [Kiritimatiellota bacterium]MBL7011385.1 30S ribosomal protein S16 [Kiritimatiellales bacterium]